MKRILLSVAMIAAIGISEVFGVPAKRSPFIVKQSDGTELTLRLVGDEFSHRYITAEGHTVLKSTDGNWYYAESKNGSLYPSSVRAGKKGLSADENRIAALSLGLKATPSSKKQVITAQRQMRQKAKAAGIIEGANKVTAKEFGIWGGEIKGIVKGLVILVNFQDVKFTTASPKNAFSNMLNQPGYSQNTAKGSAYDYFVSSSSGVFTPQFVVAGPYTVSQKMEYYGGNDDTPRKDDLHPEEMIAEACALAAADGIDFSQFASDGKTVDNVFVYYAGYNEAEGQGSNEDTVWPHQFYLVPGQTLPAGTNVTFNGVKVYSYACSSELRGSSGGSMAGIGTFCHEFGHVIGLPDFYDTDGETNGAASGLMTVSVMDAGSYVDHGDTPPTHTLLERWMLGWAEPTEITEEGKYTLEPLYNNKGFLLKTTTENEFFLLENRSKGAGNKWDKALLEGDNYYSNGGGGMLVYHIDYTKQSVWKSNGINSDANHECVRLFRADLDNASHSGDNIYYYSRYWYYPGQGNVTALSDKTSPALLSWNGTRTELIINKIAEDGNNIVLTVSGREFEIDARQHDVLIKWAPKVSYTSWQLTIVPDGGGESITVETSEKTALISGLVPETEYKVTLKGKTGTTLSSTISTGSFTTAEKAAVSMSALQIEATYATSDYIRLSVKNLDCIPQQIEWYVDNNKASSAYLKLAAGKHSVCAIVTDTAGNTEYLFRYITVTK